MTRSIDAQPVVQVAPARFVVIKLAATITGLTERAIEGKISKGQWASGRQYRKGPDGRIYIDMEGYTKWLLTGRA